MVTTQEINERHESQREADRPEYGHNHLMAFELIGLVAQVDAHNGDHGDDVERWNCGERKELGAGGTVLMDVPGDDPDRGQIDETNRSQPLYVPAGCFRLTSANCLHWVPS